MIGKLLTWAVATVVLTASGTKGEAETLDPMTYKMQLVWMVGTEPSEWVFVVGHVGFKSLDSFKEFVGRLPKGSTLEWAPGCKRMGGEPLLSSEEEMEGFRKFCEERGIRFVLVPSG
jgi:hypothetical protein